MKKVFAVAAVLALLGMGLAAQAAITIETVPVGDPGNAPDTRYSTPGYGSVGYNYNIGKYEVTAGQYTAFLNAKAKTDDHGLYNLGMDTDAWTWGCNIKRTGLSGNYSYSVASDWANRPVNLVSYWDCLRFVNWLGNGQGDGDTENGAYTLNGYIGGGGGAIQRNAGAKWALTSEDEWYKAAYYKGGTNAGYWNYATQSDIAPANQVLGTDPGNSANYAYVMNDYGTFGIGSPYYRTNAGEFENSASAYGTFDQCGNVFEWNEAVTAQYADYADRGIRGGAYDHSSVYLPAGMRLGGMPATEYDQVGFRVSAVPEPSSLLVLLSGIGGLGGLMWRRRR